MWSIKYCFPRDSKPVFLKQQASGDANYVRLGKKACGGFFPSADESSWYRPERSELFTPDEISVW